MSEPVHEPVPRSDVVALGPKVDDWRTMALDQLRLARYRQHSAAGLDGLLAYGAVYDCSGSA